MASKGVIIFVVILLLLIVGLVVWLLFFTNGCKLDADCGEKGLCLESKCVDRKKGDPCFNTNQCPVGLQCNNSICGDPLITIAGTCVADTSCASGFCDNGICALQHAIGESCVRDAQCNTGTCLATKICGAAVTGTTGTTGATGAVAHTSGGTKKAGETCYTSNECFNYKVGSGLACCQDPVDQAFKCTEKIQNKLGDWWCPIEAVKADGSSAVGDYCRESSECAGYTLGGKEGNVFCCLNKCTPIVKDLAGNYDCPNVATGQLPLGTECKTGSDCAGYTFGSAAGTTCCPEYIGGPLKCTQKKKDYLGAYYCPLECVGTFLGKPNTCF